LYAKVIAYTAGSLSGAGVVTGSVARLEGASRGITSSGTQAALLDHRNEPRLVSCKSVPTLIPTLPE
jgi:hypothetical protein